MSKCRKGLGFGKRVTRAARNAHGSSLCPNCKAEHGNQADHTLGIDVYNNAPEIAREFFRSIGVACESDTELQAAMKSDANLGLLCGRCHFDKSTAENSVVTYQEKLLIALRWYGVSFSKSGKRRTTRPATREKARPVAVTIARDSRAMDYHKDKGNFDEFRKAAKRRAAKRREVRGIA